jgi:hypothetical protein
VPTSGNEEKQGDPFSTGCPLSVAPGLGSRPLWRAEHDIPVSVVAAGCAPLSLQVVEPGHKLSFPGVFRGWRAVMVITVAGQEREVVADRLAAQSQDGPSGARRRRVPVRPLKAAEQFAQASSFEAEQAGDVSRRVGGGLVPLIAATVPGAGRPAAPCRGAPSVADDGQARSAVPARTSTVPPTGNVKIGVMWPKSTLAITGRPARACPVDLSACVV